MGLRWGGGREARGSVPCSSRGARRRAGTVPQTVTRSGPCSAGVLPPPRAARYRGLRCGMQGRGMWGCRIRGCGMKDVGCRDSSSRCGMSRWREGAGYSHDLGFSGVASPGAKELQVVMSPPGGICPWARWSQGSGVPALRAHRDLPALAFSPLAPRREGERAPLCPSPDLARRQTDRQIGRSSPGARTRRTRRWDPAGGGGLGAGRVEEGEETDPPSLRDTRVTESPAGPTRHRSQAGRH